MKICVLDAGTLKLPEEVWDLFTPLGEYQLFEHTPQESDVIAERISDAEAVFTNKVPITSEVFAACSNIKFIGVLATGYNIIDLGAAEANRVTVCNVPGYSTASTSQHAVSLILELCNQVGLHSASVHEGDWAQSRHFSYWKQAPLELESMTVGIVGFGTIGRRVAAVLSAMGARILASARRRKDTPEYDGFEWESTEAIFRKADLVSLHCPETRDNSGFVNASLLATMKRGALLVNTARGGLVNELDLADALQSGHLSGAALDVVSKEPMSLNSPLIGLKKCIITPHIAWASEPSRLRLIHISTQNLKSYLAGEPINTVSVI